MSDRGWRRACRAQSETIGVVLLFGLILTGASLVVVLGADAIGESQDRAGIGGAEQTMSQFDSQTSLVAHGSVETREVELPADRSGAGGTTVDPSAGTMTIDISGDTTYTETITLGTVRYDQGATTVAYQGGGVWRHADNGTVMVTPPEFHYRVRSDGSPTLTLPLVTVEGEAGGPTARITRTGPTTSLVPNGSRQNPIRDSEVNVTVQSRYYRGWGQFFEERTDGKVTYDHAANEVTIQLVATAQPVNVNGALVTGAGALALDNAGTIDSYDSDDGPYSTTKGENAPVVVEGDFAPSNSVTIEGSVDAGGGANVSNSIRVTGPVRINGTSDPITNSPVFEGPYHTGGNLHVDGSSNLQFRDDVYVGGDVTKFEKGGSDPIIDGGTLYVGGSATIMSDIDGDVIATGNVTLMDDATIDGNVESGENVIITNKQVTITGDVVANGYLDQNDTSEVLGDVTTGGDAEGDGDAEDPDGAPDEGSIGGTTSENGPADPAPPVAPEEPYDPDLPSAEAEVTDAEADYSASNDNNGTVAADGKITDSECSPGCTLPAGEYYVDSVNIDGGNLTFDTTNGGVAMYIAGDSTLQGTTTVEVNGDAEVQLYFGNGTGQTFTIKGQTEVLNPGDKAPKFWLYTHPDATVDFQNQVIFRGVVYGADNSSAGTEVSIQNKVKVYGAIVGDVTQTSNNNELHYDEALAVSEAFEGATTSPKVAYLHVSVTEVRVGD